MPTNTNANQPVKRNPESSVRKSVRKAPGTRVGTIQDWRGVNNSGKSPARHGQSIRDGR